MPTHADDQALKAVLSAAIGAHLGILNDLGYRGPELATTDSVVLPGVRATFTASTRELRLDVAHPSTDPRALKRHVMVAFVYRRGEGREGSLYVDWFAAVHRPDLFDALERLANGDGTLNGGTTHATWRIRFADAAERIKAHPEVLSGDFRPIRDWKKVG